MNHNLRILLAGLLTTAVVLAPAVGLAQDKPKAPSANNAVTNAPAGARPVPFRGTVTAVDKQAMSVTVGERVFYISSETRLIKNTQPGTFADIAVGDAIAGNYLKSDDGKLTARMVRFGPKPDSKERAPKPDKSAEKKATTTE
jgi:hypothetical protein